MQPDILTYIGSLIQYFLIFFMGREKIIKIIFFLPPKMVKPPPIKPILWSPVKSEKSQKLTKMSFLDFYQYLGLFSMDGRHVPLWERYSACGREILPVEEMYSCGREYVLGSIPWKKMKMKVKKIKNWKYINFKSQIQCFQEEKHMFFKKRKMDSDFRTATRSYSTLTFQIEIGLWFSALRRDHTQFGLFRLKMGF